jgi:hypothetical protein
MAGFLLPLERSVSALAEFPIRSDRVLVAAFAALAFPLNSAFPNMDGGCVEHRLDVGCVKFLDHLDAGAAVPGDLVDVRALHEAEADIGVPEAIARAHIAIAVELELKFVENGVQQTALLHRKESVSRLRLDQTRLRFLGAGLLGCSVVLVGFRNDLGTQPVPQSLEGEDCLVRAFAPADAAFTAYLDLKNRFLAAVILNNLYVAEFEPGGLVRA